MTDHDTTTAKPERTWVWWCNEESIAAGKISALAIVETFAAVGLWWWLAIHFNWSEYSFITLIAAPILLLRSPESIALGVSMLKWLWNTQNDSVSIHKKIIMFAIGALLAAYLNIDWLMGYSGWTLFWLATSLGAVAVSFSFVSAFSGRTVHIFAGAMMFSVCMSILQINIFMLVFAPLLTSGILMRSQFIRWIATLRYPLIGLKRLPHNWRETLWVIDPLHQPELIPQAGTISKELAVKTLWLEMKSSNVSDKIIHFILILELYIPALVYRWSLKASAWLWLPLILLPKLPLESLDNVGKSRQIGRLVSGLSRFLPIVAVIVSVWLTLALLPEFTFLLNVLPEKLGELVKGFGEWIQPPQIGGIRYITLWLFCGLTLLYWRDVDHYKTDKTSCADLTDEQDKAQFQQELTRLAGDIENLRSILIVTVLIWGEATAAHFLHTLNLISIAPWLLRIL